MKKISRLFAFISAIALAIGITVVASGPASAWDGVGWQIQNKATGLCLTGTVDIPTAKNPVYEAPCGTKPTQYWGNWTNMLVMVDAGAYNICLTANTYGDVYTTGCQADGDTGWSYGDQAWKFASLRGDYTNLYSEAHGCYAQVISGQAACMLGWSGDSKQFRFMSTPVDSPPAVPNTVRLVDLRPDGRLQNAEGDYSAGGWTPWSDMGASGIREVTSAATGSVNRIFAIAGDGQVYEKDGNYANQQWSGWFQPATGGLPSPAVAISASSYGNTVHLVIVGADGHLYNSDGDFAAGRWNGWTDHGAGFKRVTSVSTADNVNHIFAIDSSNRIDELDANYATSTWGTWRSAGSVAFTAQDVAASASGDIVHLSAVAVDGSWSNTEGNFDTGRWDGWTKMSGSGLKRIASAAANNVNHIFAVDGSNRLMEIDGDYNTGHWSSWAQAAAGADAIGVTATFTH
ncbi:hypothetical protein ACIRSU_11690 [Streptomyces sp. NPDC101160]|uniref:hypothetical protein n=1 Tax=Streptomyces sp. NPDC101160 TaxID=3366118 RepID=UPI003821B034